MKEIKDLVAGDVVIHHHSSYVPDTAARIERVTATQIIIGSSRFNRESGRVIGNTERWTFPNIRIPKEGEVQKLVEESERRLLASKISDMKWGNLSLAQLKQVHTLLATFQS